MHLPLDLWTLSLWLAVTAIMLLITTQIVSAYEGEMTLLVDKRRLRNVALLMGILFLTFIAVRIYGAIASV